MERTAGSGARLSTRPLPLMPDESCGPFRVIRQLKLRNDRLRLICVFGLCYKQA
jgi:hypothetical protein